ncbi:MAG: cytochrome B [Xanthomonadales bacterium]|nr:cytochrome B [Stutzerimonas stutzeri]NIT32658.1 cytochrome B [Xanthomonadales bacterium]
MHVIRIWDLPTRLFHWLLAVCVVGLVATGTLGGAWMAWHLRLGYAVLALLLFRLLWGFLGGRWSRFASFVYSPRSLTGYLRGRAPLEHTAGHTPLGALSVFALLLVLATQVGSGLMSDDEIATFGPLTRFVSGDTVSAATGFHKDIGQYLVIALVVLHLLAIVWYRIGKRQSLVRPMVLGDKQLPAPLVPSRDGLRDRVLAAALLGVCVAFVGWLVSVGYAS